MITSAWWRRMCWRMAILVKYTKREIKEHFVFVEFRSDRFVKCRTSISFHLFFSRFFLSFHFFYFSLFIVNRKHLSSLSLSVKTRDFILSLLMNLTPTKRHRIGYVIAIIGGFLLSFGFKRFFLVFFLCCLSIFQTLFTVSLSITWLVHSLQEIFFGNPANYD